MIFIILLYEEEFINPQYIIVNDITNFCFRFLPKPYTGAFAGPKTKFLMSLTINIIARPVEKVKNGYVYIIRGRNKRIGICFMKESPLWGCAFQAQAGNSPL